MKQYKHEPTAEFNGGGEWSIAAWVACSCGWNERFDDYNRSWREHFESLPKEEQEAKA